MDSKLSARDALTTAAVQRALEDEPEAFEDFLRVHAGWDWLNDCPDNLCRQARKQADDILAALVAAGYKVVASNG